MTFRKFLYDYILAQGFRLQDYPKLFLWVPILGDVYRIKRRSVDHLQLQRGNKVLIYSIGAGFGLDFILERIGETGFVVGVDFSESMLKIAQEKVDKNGWKNVRLVLADLRKYDPSLDIDHKVDAALSIFGYLDKEVIADLINALNPGGRIVISGPQPLKGWRKIFYPVTFVPEMIFGLTWKNLHQFPGYIDIFKKDLKEVNIDEKTFAKYFVAVSGIKK